MEGNVLKEFLARLGFQVDEASAQHFNKSLASSTVKLAAFGAAIQAVAAGIYAAVYKVAEQEARFLALSDSTGVAVETLQELTFVAEQTDASASKLADSIEGLQKSMGEATQGKGGLEAFHRLGIRITDANGHLRDTVDVLFEVGERIKGLDEGKRSMFLSQLGIDRSLVRMLTEDVSGLQSMYQEMYAASGVNARQAAEDSRAYVDEVHTIKTVLGMVAKSVAVTFIGKMRANLTNLRKAIIENFGKITAVIQGVLKLFLRIAGAFGALTMRIMKWVGGLVGWFGKLDDSVQTIILAVLGFAAAWKWLNLSFLATPLGMLIGLATLIVGIIDDFQTWLEGGESLLDWGDSWTVTLGLIVGGLAAVKVAMIAIPAIMGAISAAGAVLSGVLSAIGAAAAANPLGFFLLAAAMVATFVITHWTKLQKWFADFASWLKRLWGGVGRALKSVWSGIKDFFRSLWDGVANTFHQVVDRIRRPFEVLFAWLEEKFGWVGDVVNAVVDTVSEVAGAVSDAANWAADGLSSAADWITGTDSSSPVLAPAPALAAAGPGRGDTSLEAKATIHVHGASSPEATGRAVGREQTRVNADLVRNARGAVR